jgi:hypothetical protein
VLLVTAQRAVDLEALGRDPHAAVAELADEGLVYL